MGSSCAPLKRGNDPLTPSGSRFDCILLERYVNTLASGVFPPGRDLHPSRGHVFPETYPRQSNLFQSVKEQKPFFAELDQLLALAVTWWPCLKLEMEALNFVTELAVAPRLTAYCAQCLASTKRESAHSIDLAVTHDAANSRFVCLSRGLHIILGNSNGASPCGLWCALL